jgi:hypothetical protein
MHAFLRVLIFPFGNCDPNSCMIMGNDQSQQGEPGGSDKVEPQNVERVERTKFLPGRIRIACVGVGSRLRCLMRVMLGEYGDAVEVVGLCDVEEATSKTKTKLGLSDCRVWALEDYSSMLSECNAAWVMVGSRNDLHCGHVLEAFRWNCHVFCEKVSIS